MRSKNYRDLIVWEKSMELVFVIYELTAKFPQSEMFGLTSQMRRAAVSIPSNIAEGSKRGTKKDFRNFLLNSFGSGAELETQIQITKDLAFGKSLDYQRVERLLDEIMRMLNRMISKLKAEIKLKTIN